ncbi:IPT/TIG domain-containing protein [uncultured Bacteroides sp.]|uniref:IPT/TIG domain-containing protein n=1 Tax=uncultured Bacteroides sp. TaxID=162156 RepID=UPI0025F2F896|nr:IPT/TIG domain-containing protein [uncultured Bacteroides sp.]
MKTNHFIVSFFLWISCALLFVCSCGDAELALFDAAKVKIKAEWKDYSFHFSADVESSGNLKIEERGFVQVIPAHYEDMGSCPEQTETLIIPLTGDFSYQTEKDNLMNGLECRVYAYVKTNFGNFRSEMAVLKIPNQSQPQITSVHHVPLPEGPYWGGGTVYIDGTGFSNIKKRIVVSIKTVGDLWNPPQSIYLDVQEVSFTRIVATYPSNKWNLVGDFPLTVFVGNYENKAVGTFKVEGVILENISPSVLRYGEKAMIQMSGFSPDNDFQLATYAPGDYKIVSTSEQGVELQVFPNHYDSNSDREYQLFYYDKNTNMYSTRLSFHVPASKWVERNSFEMLSPNAGQYNCFYQGKGYFYDTDNFFNSDNNKLKVYDLETFSWEYYPLMDNEHNYGTNEYANLFAHEGYIYLSIKRRRYNEETGTVLSWQCFYRFNVNTHQWEQLKNIADNAEDCMNIDAVWFDGQQLYMHSDKPFLWKYNPTTDSWQKTTIHFPADFIFAGEHNSYIYYQTEDTHIYRFKKEQPEKVEYFGTLELPVSKEAAVCGNYIYYRHKIGVFRIPLSQPIGGEMLEVESLGAMDAFYYCHGTFFSHNGDINYLLATRPIAMGWGDCYLYEYSN